MKESPSVKVRDVMTSSLVFVAAEDSAMKAAGLMGEKRVSSVLVKRREKYSGILTDRDIIVRIVSKGLDPGKIRVGDVMTSPLITIGEEETIEAAAKKMREKNIRRLVVTRNDQTVGIIAESDMIRIDPELHFLIRERSKLEATTTPNEPQEILLAGFCEECENYSGRLKNTNGVWLCEDCRE
jgi:CBS domain-containing protein